MSTLQARLLAAHEQGDKAALVALYTQAADGTPDADAVGFFLTQAYVFALETDHAHTPALRARLVEMGREIQL